MDLKDFAKSKSFSEEKEEIGEKNSAEEQAKNIYNKYKDFSKDQLTDEIAKIIKSQKQSGTFNKENILASLKSLSAFIPAESLNGLSELIERIDAEN